MYLPISLFKIGALTDADAKGGGIHLLFISYLGPNYVQKSIYYCLHRQQSYGAKFSATDADIELYIMESFHDYKMANNRSVVEQTHEVHCIVKELELFKCDLLDKFVVGA